MISGNAVNNATSYIGFRGIEDLGGGLKAGFRLEQYVNMKNGATASPNGFLGNENETYGRAANLWLEGGFGQFKMGRSETPSYNAMLAWSIVGDAVYSPSLNRYSAVGRWARSSSQFSYKTPVFAGFSAEVAFVAKGDNGNKAKYDLNVVYENGPIIAGVAYNKIQDAKANYALGAKYDFGMFALSAGYYGIRNLVGQSFATGAEMKLAGFSVGGSVKFDNITLAVELQRQHKSEIRQQNVLQKYKKYTEGVVEAKYALSKRTFIYADYLRMMNKNNYGVGIQHRF
ncbi:porin [Ottowia massiliensis]|uniref:porin n=1 Tax=Ottowia massiliensis TaxID=2045302 RepID=UPI001303FC34|nr:porin [Ottowia massiliensis]